MTVEALIQRLKLSDGDYYKYSIDGNDWSPVMKLPELFKKLRFMMKARERKLR